MWTTISVTNDYNYSEDAIACAMQFWTILLALNVSVANCRDYQWNYKLQRFTAFTNIWTGLSGGRGRNILWRLHAKYFRWNECEIILIQFYFKTNGGGISFKVRKYGVYGNVKMTAVFVIMWTVNHAWSRKMTKSYKWESENMDECAMDRTFV